MAEGLGSTDVAKGEGMHSLDSLSLVVELVEPVHDGDHGDGDEAHHEH